MEITDFVKQSKSLYQPKTEPVIIDVPSMRFLMIDGHGQPEGGPPGDDKRFQAAIGALYGMVYTLKFSQKKGNAPVGFMPFKVPPLEGLWWMRDERPFDMSRPADWRWTLMIRVPDFVTKQVVKQFASELVEKKQDETFSKLRLEDYLEGTSVQLMHIGPYSEEGPNIEKMHQFAKGEGYSLRGRHHEIYYGDPRRTAPEKLRTLLRQPITR